MWLLSPKVSVTSNQPGNSFLLVRIRFPSCSAGTSNHEKGKSKTCQMFCFQLNETFKRCPIFEFSFLIGALQYLLTNSVLYGAVVSIMNSFINNYMWQYIFGTSFKPLKQNILKQFQASHTHLVILTHSCFTSPIQVHHMKKYMYYF